MFLLWLATLIFLLFFVWLLIVKTDKHLLLFKLKNEEEEEKNKATLKKHLDLLLFCHSVVSDTLRPHGLHVTCKASLSFTISWSLFKLRSIELMIPYHHLIFCHPLLLLPSVFLSIKVFSNEMTFRLGNYFYVAMEQILIKKLYLTTSLGLSTV